MLALTIQGDIIIKCMFNKIEINNDNDQYMILSSRKVILDRGSGYDDNAAGNIFKNI